MTERQLKLVSPEGDKLPPASPFHNEGRTLAGWFLTWGLIITSALVGAGLIAHVMPLTIAGLVGVVVTLIGSAALRAAGHGQPHARSRD